MEIDIFAARQFGMKTGADFDQRGESSPDGNFALGRTGDTGKDPQYGRLAGAVMPDDAQSFPFFDLETYIPEGPHVLRSPCKSALIPPPRRIACGAEIVFLRYSVELQVNHRAVISHQPWLLLTI